MQMHRRSYGDTFYGVDREDMTGTSCHISDFVPLSSENGFMPRQQSKVLVSLECFHTFPTITPIKVK